MFLSDNILIQKGLELLRPGGILDNTLDFLETRKTVIGSFSHLQGKGALARKGIFILLKDKIAQIDAFVTYIHTRAGNQLQDFILAFPAE
jgi:hypothetical protein